MPFEIVASSDQNYQLLSESVARIGGFVVSSVHENINILITDVEHMRVLFPGEYETYKGLIATGFGLSIGNKPINGSSKHIIIISIENMAALNFNDSEIDGVLSHELGHLLNEPEPYTNKKGALLLQYIGGMISPEEYQIQNEKAIEESEKYEDNKEFYADHFSKMLKCKLGLLSSMNKYLAQDVNSNLDRFERRINKINSDEVFIGKVKQHIPVN